MYHNAGFLPSTVGIGVFSAGFRFRKILSVLYPDPRPGARPKSGIPALLEGSRRTNVGALVVLIGFGDMLYCHYYKEPPK